MKSAPTYTDYLCDILDAVQGAQEFTQGMDAATFAADKRTNFAVVRALNIIGEATNRLAQTLRDRYPQVSWREAAGMRDKLSHDYFGVDLLRVWETVRHDLPALCGQIRQMPTDLQNEGTDGDAECPPV